MWGCYHDGITARRRNTAVNRTSITGLACLLAVALTACAGGGEPPAPSGSPASAPLEALKEPANSMSVSPPLSPAPVSAEALAAYRPLLAGEPGALDRPPEGLELLRVRNIREAMAVAL